MLALHISANYGYVETSFFFPPDSNDYFFKTVHKVWLGLITEMA